MNKQQQMVLACIDDSSLSEAVCDYAAWIAQRLNTPLKLLHTIDHHHETALTTDLSGNLGVDGHDHLLEELTNLEQQQGKLRIQQGKKILNTAKQRVVADGIPEPKTCLQHGSLIESLVELEKDIRVLVIGARGKVHEDKAGQIGAKLESIIRSLHRPILVAYQDFKLPKNIMIAYDGSESSEKVVDMIVSSQLYKSLTCHLVHVSKKAGSDTLLEKAANQLKAVGEIEIISASLQGKPVQTLCEYQTRHDIDLTIMGAFSHTRLHDLVVGSFTHKMLLKTEKPLLLLR
ncbi:MAG TPA: universal stress protein [Crenotrichaceae bacterium]|nr:universal stress protein [Crenotrichaceae bacterium]